MEIRSVSSEKYEMDAQEGPLINCNRVEDLHSGQNDKPRKATWKQKMHFPKQLKIKAVVKSYLDRCNGKMYLRCFILYQILVQLIVQIFVTSDSPSLEFLPSNKTQVWRYYTYSLIHSSWFHLGINSLAQILYGSLLEPIYGPKIPLIFFFGVLAGSLMQAVSNSKSSLQGASAGASALLLARLSDVARQIKFSELFQNFKEIFRRIVSVIPVAWFAINTIILIKKPNSQSVSVWSHISGGVTGLLLGFISTKTNKKNICITVIVSLLEIVFLGILIYCNIRNIHT